MTADPAQKVHKMSVELAVAQGEITTLRARVAELEAENGILRRRAADQHKIMSAHLSNQRKTIKRLEIEATTRWHLLRQHHGESVKATKRAERAEAELSRRGQIQVKPLVWPDFREGGTCGRPHHFQYFVTQDRHGVFWAHFDMSQHGTLEAAQQHCEQHYQRAALVSPGDGWRRCDGCRAVGAIHCAHPDECGNMKHVSVADLIAQADSWRSWLDDLPLPDDFREGVNDCQQYIADLSYALQPQPAPPASEGKA